MEPVELKKEAPTLVVGESGDQIDTEEKIKITTGGAKANPPALLSEEMKLEEGFEKEPEETPAVESAAAALTEKHESEEEKTFVLTIVDILAVLYIFAALAGSIFVPGLAPGSGFDITAESNVFTGLVLVFNLIIGSYWFSDIVSRIHKVRRDLATWPTFDKLACIHPALVVHFCMLPYYLNSAFGDHGNLRTTTGIQVVMLLAIALPLSLRWLYLNISLANSSANLVSGKAQQNIFLTGMIGALASVSLFGYVISSHAPSFGLVITLISGLVFMILRNLIIQASPSAAQMPPSPPKTAVPDSDEVVMPYNHFVELQKWFKQKFALRSPWKIGLILGILLAAVATYNPVNVINLIAVAVVATGTHIGGGFTPTLETSAIDPNSIANRLLALGLAFTFLATAACCFWIFLRAPKRLSVGRYGLRLKFSPFSGLEDVYVPWYSVQHIKVERPPGKTSAASDRLVFERDYLQPFSLKLAAIASTDDREKLLASIDRFAPQIKRDAAIEETLRRPIEQNYTELWLQALAAPPKREKFKPLLEGASLNGDRYLVKGELGAGGQGFAYLAKDKLRDRLVVLKESVLPVFVDINARKQSLESFEKEAKLLASLDHPQVVKLEGFFVEDHRAYLVLEHIDGENLREIVLRDGPMKEERIRKLGIQMCTILGYLHGLSPPLVHRDFTPDNLILRKDGTLKLIDFNVAQQVEYATTGTVVGKQAYLPPEQFRGQAVPASDFYALGATLYFLAAAKDPVAISVARPIKDGLTLSAELDHLISGLTQMEAEARPTRPLEVAKLLKQYGQEGEQAGT